MRIWERGAQSNSLGRAWEVSTRWCASWVGSAGQGLRSQGSYGRWGFALPRCGNGVLRSDARFGAVPLRLRCLGFGLFGDRLKADGGWDSWGVLLLGGGLRGTGPALAGIVREVGLSRCRAVGMGCFDPMLAPALSRCSWVVLGGEG